MHYGNTEVYLTAQEREELIQAYLGKTVEVIIDRPIGFVHYTKGIRLDYTVNYGFLPGVIGGDGEEQDVYVLGADGPMERFTGRIIGAVRRKDDNEDKLVAAPEGIVPHQGQIAEAIYFVEKYFDSTVESLFHKSCGVIPCRRNGENWEFLLLYQQASGFWSFPKGHMEAWEREEDTACRELREEIGLETKLLPGFRTTVEYRLSEISHKEVVLFLGEVEGKLNMQPEEIEQFRWVSMEKARGLMGEAYAQVMEQVEKYVSSL